MNELLVMVIALGVAGLLSICVGLKLQLERAVDKLERQAKPKGSAAGGKAIWSIYVPDEGAALFRPGGQACSRAFSVTVGTIFHGTHISLRQWFLVLALMLNAKKSASACQIARDLGMRRPTVWSMMHRVRLAMANDQKQAALLSGIVEADETYIGGKPRKTNRRDDDKPNKRGRGTSKTAVVGVVERGGRVVAMPAKPKQLSWRGLSNFISRFVDRAGTLLITDEFGGYNRVSETMLHAKVNHSVEYANGIVHTNTIEGFWSLVKRAWYGQHHHYSTKYINLYISEACYKYNQRKAPCSFDHLLGVMVAA